MKLNQLFTSFGHSFRRSVQRPHRASFRSEPLKKMAAAADFGHGHSSSSSSSKEDQKATDSDNDSADGISIPNYAWSASESSSLNMSFAGCGFLGIYHLGAASTFQKYGSPFLRRVDRFAGASAGALVAAVLAVRGDDPHIMKECIDFTYNLAKGVQDRKLGLLTPGLNLLDSLKDFLEEHLPEDAHIIATNRLYVSLTTASSKRNIIVSEFDSKQDLIQCLLATSYVPHITGIKPVMRNGKKFIDGGMTDNLPILRDGRTVCVSPFSGRYEVCPMDTSRRKFHVNINRQDFQVNFQNIVRGLHAFFPPKISQLQDYYYKGVRDAHHFLQKEGWYESAEDRNEDINDTSKDTDQSSSSPRDTQSPETFQFESTL